MDARQLKSRQKLHAAVLDLAERSSIADLTVSALSTRAGVHRSTFYEHASSPVDLLQAALGSELDEIRDRFLVGADEADAAAAVLGTTTAVLDHVDAHAAIYQRGLGDGSSGASLHAMLSAHFQDSIRLLVSTGAVVLPAGVGGMSANGIREGVAHFIADGTVGLIEAWLQGQPPRDKAQFLQLFAELVPSWWPLADNETITP